MCGIIGFVYTGPLNLLTKERKCFARDSLILDMVRGYNGTGIITVDNKKDISMYKRALCGMDFVGHRTASCIIEGTSQANLFVGHNRAATRGKVSDATTHPFCYDHITLVHNGTLDYVNGLNLPHSERKEVDSEEIAWALSQKEPNEVLPKIQGAYVLVWHDSRDNTVVFARNEERPLYFMHNKKDNLLLFSSCPDILNASLKDRIQGEYTIPELEKPYLVGSGKCIRVSLTEEKPIKKNWTITDFTPAVPPTYTYPSTSNYSSGSSYSSNPDFYILMASDLTKGDTVLIEKTSVEKVLRSRTNSAVYTVKGRIVSTDCNQKSIGDTVHSYGLSPSIIKENKTIYSATVQSAFYSTKVKKYIIVVGEMIAAGTKDDLKEGKLAGIEHREMDEEFKIEKETSTILGFGGLALSETEFDQLTSMGCTWCGLDIDKTNPDAVEWCSEDSPLCSRCAHAHAHTNNFCA